MSDRPRLSIIVPMRNEAGNIAALVSRLSSVLSRLQGGSEIIAVDDGSTDDTLATLQAVHTVEPRLKIVSFSRNFGKEVALAAGLRYARGDAVILMDADLQHPPELIPEFVRAWQGGHQMVFGIRRDRRSEGRLRRWAARAFYALFARVSTTELPRGGGDFRLLDRRVVDAMNAMPERTRFTKGLYAWLGFKQLAVPYDVPPRAEGRSAWSLRGLWRFAVDGVVSFSTLPLRVWSYVGAAISCFAIAYALYLALRTLLFGVDVPGYPSLMVAVMFFSGVQLLSLGIIGEYVGRIFTEVKRRPLYVVATEVGFEAPVVPEVTPVLAVPTPPTPREPQSPARRVAAREELLLGG